MSAIKGKSELRTAGEITVGFIIKSSRHLQPLLNRVILDVEELHLRLRSIEPTESDANLSDKDQHLFIRRPLPTGNGTTVSLT